MRTIEPTRQFRRDYKREKKGPFGSDLDTLLEGVIDALAADEAPSPKLRDHRMTGNWKDCRDCHLRPDLVLIYRKVGDDRLQLIRLGSHSELSI